jgi:two-component system nitrogen regulation sensor histidine kinase NtrY
MRRAMIGGFVFVFEDRTEFIKAQKTAAWQEVAQRIAHEIKNPLTPIQLSAQRLRKKFLEKSTDFEEIFFCPSAIYRSYRCL